MERARARHPAFDPAAPKLADAQLIIAREYGFASWPRLVRYFEGLNRPVHEHDVHPGQLDMQVRTLMAGHAHRVGWVATRLAAYVPRFYGQRPDDAFAQTPTEDEARLAVARSLGCPSWAELQERARLGTHMLSEHHAERLRPAREAVAVGDLEALKRAVADEPSWLRPTPYEIAKGRSLMLWAIGAERKRGRETLRPIVEWLEGQGLSLAHALNVHLCGVGAAWRPEFVRYALERGGDPDALVNGVPVLEHALLNWWNGPMVDKLAERAHPRRALWIAAGLGDLDGVRRSLDGSGKPLPGAVRLRPDYEAACFFGIASHPEPDDEDLLLEAFFVAMLNDRTEVMEYLVSRGFPVNTARFGMPMIHFAVGNMRLKAVESLLRCGADPDIEAWDSNGSARDLARGFLEEGAVSAESLPRARRVAELLGVL